LHMPFSSFARVPPHPRSTLFPYTTLFRSRQRPELSGARARAAVFLDDGVPRRLGLRQLGGRLRQLVEPLPEVLPVPGDHLELPVDRKSTRLNSSHVATSYAVFCLKKKTEA